MTLVNQPQFKGYKEAFHDAFCKKFTDRFQAEKAFDKLVDAAISEFKNFPVDIYLLSKTKYPLAIKLGEYTNNHETRQMPDEKVYHNGKLMVQGGASGIYFYDPENPKTWIKFFSDETSVELNVMQDHEYGYDDYLFWHSDSGTLKKYIHCSGNYTDTTDYNLDGTERTVIDRFKDFFSF